MLRMCIRWLSEARTLGSHRPAVAMTGTAEDVSTWLLLLVPSTTLQAAAARYVDLKCGKRQSAGRTGPLAKLCFMMLRCCAAFCGCMWSSVVDWVVSS